MVKKKSDSKTKKKGSGRLKRLGAAAAIVVAGAGGAYAKPIDLGNGYRAESQEAEMDLKTVAGIYSGTVKTFYTDIGQVTHYREDPKAPRSASLSPVPVYTSRAMKKACREADIDESGFISNKESYASVVKASKLIRARTAPRRGKVRRSIRRSRRQN